MRSTSCIQILPENITLGLLLIWRIGSFLIMNLAMGGLHIIALGGLSFKRILKLRLRQKITRNGLRLEQAVILLIPFLTKQMDHIRRGGRQFKSALRY